MGLSVRNSRQLLSDQKRDLLLGLGIRLTGIITDGWSGKTQKLKEPASLTYHMTLASHRFFNGCGLEPISWYIRDTVGNYSIFFIHTPFWL